LRAEPGRYRGRESRLEPPTARPSQGGESAPDGARPWSKWRGSSLNRTAFAATWHCLTGCAIGEVLGLVIATALGWGNVASIEIAVVLAFFFGYA
jgi:hypothetical protein